MTGDPVLASVTVQSATAATLSGTAMTFGPSTGVLPGNSATGTETYSVGTNDASGAKVTATWDDSFITGNNVGSLVPLKTGNNNTVGFEANELLSTAGPNYDQGMVNLSILACNFSTSICGQDTVIPWSALSVAPATGAGGTAATFAYDATGGVDPSNTSNVYPQGTDNNTSGPAGQGGGSTVATVASFTGPLTTTSYTDTYTLNVPASQEAGIYAADLWYLVTGN